MDGRNTFYCRSFPCFPQASVSGASADWNEKTIRDNLQLVAEWQAKHPKKRSPLHWTYGAFYSGLVQYGLSVPEGPGLPLLRKAGEE